MPQFLLLFLLSMNLMASDLIWVSADKIKGTNQKSSATTYTISKEDLERNQGSTLFDLIKKVPGLTINQSGGEGKTTQIKIRGMENRHTLVLLDGMELNDPSLLDRSADLSTIDLTQLESIEVIKGPQTVLYGSDAIGGVIHLHSKREVINKNSLIAGTGSYHEQKAQLFHSQTLGKKTFYNLGFSQSASEGFSSFNNKNGAAYEADGYNRYSLRGMIHHQLNQNVLIEGQTIIQGLKSETDDSTGDTQLNSNKTDNWMNSLRLTSYLGEYSENILEVQASEFDRFDLYSGGTIKSDNRGGLLKANMQHNLLLPYGFTTSFGIESEQEKMYSKSGNIDKENNNFAFYMQQKFEQADYFATVGARIDHHDIFEDFTSYKATIGYNNEVVWIKPSYSTGFKAPSLYQLYDSFSGNKNLQAEKAYAYELNSGFLLNENSRIEYSYFYNQFEQKIDALAPSYVYFNGSKNKVFGHEFTFAAPLFEQLTLEINSTFQKSFDYTDQKAVNKVPKEIHHLDLSYILNQAWRFSYDYFYKSHRREGTYRHPSYSLHQVAIEHKQKSVTYNLLLKNLFDKKYEESRNYDTAGRSYFASLKVDF